MELLIKDTGEAFGR
jgi:hypothetical protein